jgi:hypothetical protein
MIRKLFNENNRFTSNILADVDEDVIVKRINKDFAEYNMQADYSYEENNSIYFSFHYTIKYPNTKTAAEAAEEFKEGRNLDSVIPKYDPDGLGTIFSKRRNPRSAEFELTIPGTIVWNLMKNKRAQSVANPQKVYLEYLEEIIEIFVNDDRANYTKL